jgi:D-amino-acid oxidase
MHRGSFEDIRLVFKEFPNAKAIFNCTGLGSYHLKGVEDHNLYPTRVGSSYLPVQFPLPPQLTGPKGQVMLVESPSKPVPKMYFRSPARIASDTTYVFPRGKHGGVILGGCRMDGVWEGEVDPAFAEDIKRRCCALCPELGKPEDLKVISHGVGLRRKPHFTPSNS